ncbi:TPA: glycosyltransferase [Raoultella planticola]|uniref:glycosyltransferase n=1 Tax=Klebsiella/Raoultella group TaxID=2890311 RepID=UPI000B407FF4|nr:MULTISPECIES: glycosyltransferase [Klebsiella/Raoultella group]ELU1428645.1 glycosyltransferase [Raoultella planticola]HDU5631427.1 glycosyltransferase [Klebsiella pneumoniae subsp. pneumoniae]MBF7819465.1 glycosyltransferase [Klebsiella quasivariicola]MCX9755325.1 glycosyltransferase [Klebsiella pneumoniae]MCX9764561.1 glycosyltransferase [Klebsiella pneumoniae]
MVNNILSDGLLIDFLGEKPFFIFPGNTYGGHEIMSLEIINVLYNNGCYITIAVESTNEKLISAVYEKFPNADVIYLPLKQVRFEFIHTILNGYRIFKACNFLKKITTRKYSRIVLIQGDIELGSIYIKAAGILNLAIVSYIPYAHSAKKMYKRLALLRDLYYPRLFLKVSTFITISDVFRKDILSFNPSSNVLIFKNKVRNLDVFKRIRSDFLQNPNTEHGGLLKITLIGRVSLKQKGHDILVNAILKISQKYYPFFSVDIIGNGDDYEQLQKIIYDSKLDNIIKLLGWKKEPWDVACCSDLIVIPSRFEGVPLVMLEAIELGIDVIASRSDGMIDYLNPEELFNNDEDLAKILERKISRKIGMA